jgi:transposase
MDMRELKGLEIAARCRLDYQDGAWLVPSQSGKGTYRVTAKGGAESCTCEDFALTGKPCKHVVAVRIVRERDHGGAAVPLDTDKIPARPTYPQDWPAYRLAQTTEKHRFQELLFDLCQGITEPPRERKPGPKPHTLKDSIFTAAFKVYSTFSARRFACDLKDAHGKGYLSKVIPGAKANAFLENPALTPLLKELIAHSSLPLRAVETSFAPDSSGFSTSKFVRWYDHKYGCERWEHAWVKVHLICGTKTNIVTAVVIGDKNAADCPQLPELVKATAGRGFAVKEVPADKAYLSNDNLELVAALGGTAYVPFKSNSLPGEPGSAWAKLFHFFALHRDEFLPRYHKRSNVESTFSAIKRKFGDALRSRDETAMANEVLCKVLCHNLCVVIQEQCELGIEAVFWQNEPREGATAADVLPLVRPG